MENRPEAEGSADTESTPGGELDEVLSELLQGTVAPDQGISDSDGEPEGTEEELTLTKLAKDAGLDPDELFKAKFSLPDEPGTVTFEELKDAYTAKRRNEGQQSALNEEKEQFANEKLRYMQAIKALESKLPSNATEVLEAAQQAKAVYDQEQEQILQQVIPGWQDPAVKQQDAKQILELGQSYGPTTVAALADIGDAGLMKLVYDYAKLRGRISDIKSKRREAKPKGVKSKPSVNTDAADRKSRVQALASRGDKFGAIAELLKPEP